MKNSVKSAFALIALLVGCAQLGPADENTNCGDDGTCGKDPPCPCVNCCSSAGAPQQGTGGNGDGTGGKATGGDDNPAGGTPSVAGSAGAGDEPGTGGTPPSGGNAGSGDEPETGGTPPLGGGPSTGGGENVAGSAGEGDEPGTGGNQATGGSGGCTGDCEDCDSNLEQCRNSCGIVRWRCLAGCGYSCGTWDCQVKCQGEYTVCLGVCEDENVNCLKDACCEPPPDNPCEVHSDCGENAVCVDGECRPCADGESVVGGVCTPTMVGGCQDNPKKVRICHFPRGNPGNPQQLCVAIEGWLNGHGDHDLDFEGCCQQ